MVLDPELTPGVDTIIASIKTLTDHPADFWDDEQRAQLSMLRDYSDRLENTWYDLPLLAELDEKEKSLVRHEINTPLSIIMGFSFVLLGDVQDNPEATDLLPLIQAVHDKTEGLLNELNDFSHFFKKDE